jgi:hypothetical protein
MALPTSGPISISDINRELGFDFNFQNSLGSSYTRNLFGVASGAVALAANGRGKSNTFTFNKTISTNTRHYYLLDDMLNNGYTNGSAFTANITINSGVYVWSDHTSLAAFDTGPITGTGTINLTNNGFIMGKGGNGGLASGTSATAGGPAINLQKTIIITNNSYIAGGGGGGGTGTAVGSGGGGGGAGGGAGGVGISMYGGGVSGAGGAVGSSGGNGTSNVFNCYGLGGGAGGGAGSCAIFYTPSPRVTCGSGGGGGRILPGTGGGFTGEISSSGGSAGNAGESNPNNGSGGGGGGWGASGGTGRTTAGATVSGASGGKAINLNGNSVTYITTGTIYGAVS